MYCIRHSVVGEVSFGRPTSYRNFAEGMYFRDLLTELGIALLGATALCSDNKSVKELSLDSNAFKKTKHIHIYHTLRAAHFLGDLCDPPLFFEVVWIAGTHTEPGGPIHQGARPLDLSCLCFSPRSS